MLVIFLTDIKNQPHHEKDHHIKCNYPFRPRGRVNPFDTWIFFHTRPTLKKEFMNQKQEILITPIRTSAYRYKFTTFLPEDCGLNEAEIIRSKQAAATNLFDVVKEFLNFFPNRYEIEYEPEFNELIDKAKAAIEKANPQTQPA